MSLPDDSDLFPNVPLTGHICSLRVGSSRHYWRVERLIEAAQPLVPFEREVTELIEKLGNSSWFGPDERPTIRAVLTHLERALGAESQFPPNSLR